MKHLTLMRMTANLTIHKIAASAFLKKYHLVIYKSVTIDIEDIK